MIQTYQPEEATRMLQNLLGNLPGMAYRCKYDKTYTMMYLSPVCLQLTGYDPEELILNQMISYGDLILKEDRQLVWEAVNEGVQKSCRFEMSYRIRTKDNTIKWVREKGNAVYNEDNSQIQFLEGFIADITAEREAEELLMERETRLAEILKTIDLGVLFADKKGRVLETNEAFTKITGVSGQEVIGQTAMKLAQKMLGTKDQAKIIPLIVKLLKGEPSIAVDIKFNNRLLRIDTHITKNQQLVTFFADITKQKEYEDNLLKAKIKAEESDRLKSSFLANMSHEIRTPMNGIVGFAELLKEENLNKEETDRYVDIILANSEQLLHVINDVLDLSRIEAGRLGVFPHRFDPYPMLRNLEETASVLVKHKPIQVILKFDLPAKFTLESDKNRVQQVLFNLVSNAAKFTEKGTIQIGCFRNSWDYIEFYVRDSGTGVSKQVGQKIFERFRQGNEGDNRPFAGTGLGLSISQALVNLLGGQLGYTSTEGKGSYFYFTLPHELRIE